MQVNSRRRRAFTLIELLVVMLILAILAALIVPKLIGQTSDAKRAKALSDISQISNALERFRVDTDRYPTEEEGLRGSLLVRPSDVNTWNGPYLQKLPTDPWGEDYLYQQVDDKNVIVMSYAEDKAEGGEGNAADITNQDESQQGQGQ